MTNRLATAVIFCFCVTLAGCMSSVRVSRTTTLSDPNPKGIPFYAKTGVCKQETDWLKPQYTLTCEMKPGKCSDGPAEKVLTRQEFIHEPVVSFINSPANPAVWRTILMMPAPDPGEENIEDKVKQGNWVRVSNTGAVEAVVDYTNVFYLNSGRPLAGTTQVDAKLAADGTLTEASAQVQDQTLATIASTISSLVSSASTVATLGVKGAFPVNPPPVVTVTVKTKTYKHTHWQYQALGTSNAPSTCNAVAGGVFEGSFTVTEATDSAKTPTDKDNTISVSGSIVLPKTTTTPSSPPAAGQQSAPPKK
jgi:hypothetical protein